MGLLVVEMGEIIVWLCVDRNDLIEVKWGCGRDGDLMDLCFWVGEIYV